MKMRKLINDQQGIGHIGLIVGVLIVISILGFAGYRVYQNNKSSESSNSATTSNQNKKYEDARVDNSTLSQLKGTEEDDE